MDILSAEESIKRSWFLGQFKDLADIFIKGKEKLIRFFSSGKNKEPPKQNEDKEGSEDETPSRSGTSDILNF